MITYLLFAVLQITFIVCFVRCLKRKKVYSLIFAAAFLLACCLLGAILHVMINGYSYELRIDKSKLETFYIDLETVQQYEDWFCPEEQYAPVVGERELRMSKKLWLTEEPNRWINVTLDCYTNAHAAERGFAAIAKSPGMFRSHTTKKLNEDYEYCYTSTDREVGDIILLFRPDPEYRSKVAIRYKSVVFEFTEYSSQRKSRIDEAIDQLLTDYEQYKLDNDLS